jgi:hypothetical protein
MKSSGGGLVGFRADPGPPFRKEAHQELPCGTGVSFEQLVERTT